MRIPAPSVIALTLPGILQTALAGILQYCGGSHNTGGFAGNTFFITVNEIDASEMRTICSRCEGAIEDRAHGLGVMTGAVECGTEGEGAMQATVRLEGRAWTQQVIAIQDGLSECVGPLGVEGACQCLGGC